MLLLLLTLAEKLGQGPALQGLIGMAIEDLPEKNLPRGNQARLTVA